MKLSACRLAEQIAAILRKDFLIGIRRRATFAAMMFFALTTVACLSLSMGGVSLAPNFSAALLWLVIFFAACAGISGTFDDEANSGTLTTLKLYADIQAILFGKMIYVFLSLIMLAIFIVPIFVILFDVDVTSGGVLIATIFLGLIGLSAAGTLTAAITVSATVKGGLFSILLFPITLPIFLPAIALTETALTGTGFDADLLIVMTIFDAILITASSILFDYLD
ncbi:MAG: heme exporter protein CcmB [Selenomonadaceae bacterium]|nr:heme exporter protein CcmB [Selenomonadaceae bacterium]